MCATVVALALAVLALGAPAHARSRPASSATPTTTTWPPLPASSTASHGPTAATASSAARSRCPSTGACPPVSSSRSRWSAARRDGARPAHRVAGGELRRSRPGGRRPAPLVYARLPPAVRARFDVVSWDPRGTGCVAPGRLRRRRLPRPRRRRCRRCPTRRRSSPRCTAYNAAFAQGCADAIGRVRGTGRHTQHRARSRGDPRRARRAEARLPRLLVRHRRRRDVRADVPELPSAPWCSTARPTTGRRASTTRTRRRRASRNALDAFLDWCEQPRARSRPARRATSSTDRSRRRRSRCRPPTRAGGVTREGVLTPAALETGVLVHALRPRAAWPILAGALRAASTTGGAGPLLALADHYLGARSRRHVLVDRGGQRGDQLRRPSRARGAAHARPSSPTSPASRPSSRRGAGAGRSRRAPGCRKPAKGDKLGDVQVTRRRRRSS